MFCACGCLLQELPAVAATYTVTTTADSGAGSLRQAMLNANASTGLDTISFDIPGTGPFTITPASALPTISDPVILDGTTEPGYAGKPLIQINGSSLPSTNDCLVIAAGGSTVRGLAINRCPQNAIQLESLGTNVIQGNFLGTDPTGTVAMSNGAFGILIYGSPGNLIGGTNAASRNVISGGNEVGIYIYTSGAMGNVISGNYIGVSATGLAALGNVLDGIAVSSASSNLIGGSAVGAGNVISGNGGSGVFFLTAPATSNLVTGNIIGLNATGTSVISNGLDGVTIIGVAGNTIGGISAGARNIISGNEANGVNIETNGATGNMVLGNYIGTDITGKLAKANLGNGVSIGTGPGNVVGGTNAGAGNVISGNDECGVLISSSGASNNVVQGNYLGVDATGTNKLGNTLDGVQINNGASYNLVGGANGGNVISGNSSDGVFLLSGSGAGTNLVQANLIGTDSTGKKALANAGSGIAIAMEGNIIGGPSPALRNIISGNSINGIFIEGASSSNNVIEGNYIGPDITGVDPIGNGGEGIYITNAPANTIGGIGDDAGNVIGANNATGVVLYANTSGTVIQGNYIGTDSTGNNAMPNFGGIYLYGSSSNVIGGTDLGAGNIISGNSFEGIALNSPTNNGSWAGPGANSNAIQGNLIGTKANGFSPLGNQQHNIDFYTNANNNLVGGTGIYTPNNIAFATTAGYDGVRVRVGCVGNSIIQNSIFSNAGFGIVIGNYVAGQVNTSNMVTLTSVVSESITNTNTVPLPKPSSSRVFGPPYNGLPTNFTTIQGTMSTHAGSSFLVQFYENRTPNVSVLPGYGEGLYYLGSTNITTGSNGKASFTLTLPVYVPAGWYVSATATDSSNTTWEFGPDFKVTSSVVVPGVQLLSNPSFSISQSPAGVAPPAISIGWIANPTDYLLMQTSDLTPPVNWSPATGFVTASGTTNTFTTTPSGPSMFYMLLAQ